MLKKQAKQYGKSTQRPKRHASYYKTRLRLRIYPNKVHFFDVLLTNELLWREARQLLPWL